MVVLFHGGGEVRLDGYSVQRIHDVRCFPQQMLGDEDSRAGEELSLSYSDHTQFLTIRDGLYGLVTEERGQAVVERRGEERKEVSNSNPD